MTDTDKSVEEVKTPEQVIAESGILDKIAQLEQELQAENPNIQNYLRMVGDNLRQFPDLVHLLSDEQIKPIYDAKRQETQVEIVKKTAKSRGRGKSILDDGKLAGDLL